MKQYDRTSHTVYHHRYHLVWITKHRYRVLTTAMKKRVRDIIAQAAEELGVSIENGVVSRAVVICIEYNIISYELVK